MILVVFATKYVAHNPHSFDKPDHAYVLSFSTIMLNTDRHNPAILPKDKMTKEQFIRNNRETWDGKDPPKELLEQIFDSVANNEIIIKSKGDPDKKGWIKGIKAGAVYEVGRRWMCLIGNELCWYKSPTLGKGDQPVQGKIVLDYVMIKGYNEEFAIQLTVPKPVDFFVYSSAAAATAAGSISSSVGSGSNPSSNTSKEEVFKTMQLVITCENEQQMGHWVSACTANATFNVVPDFNPSVDLKIPKAPKTKTKKKN